MSQEIVVSVPMDILGQAANLSARYDLVERYQQMKSSATLRRQTTDIVLFEKFLFEAGHVTSGMKDDLSLWAGVSYGLVTGFQQWQLNQGYSIGSVNIRMSTIKTYCRMAHEADYIAPEEMSKIRGIETISHKDGRNVDVKRTTNRIGDKKSQTTLLREEHVELLKKKLRKLAQLVTT